MSPKVDFTTFTGSFLPTVSEDVGIGWDKTAKFTRIANIVIVSSEPMVNNFPGTNSQLKLSEKVPTGYRPRSTSMFHGMTQNFASGVDCQLSWEVHTDGSMYISGKSGNTQFIVHGVWVTNDAWPS